jgi:hypothetical protein
MHGGREALLNEKKASEKSDFLMSEKYMSWPDGVEQLVRGLCVR